MLVRASLRFTRQCVFEGALTISDLTGELSVNRFTVPVGGRGCSGLSNCIFSGDSEISVLGANDFKPNVDISSSLESAQNNAKSSTTNPEKNSRPKRALKVSRRTLLAVFDFMASLGG